MAEADSVHFNGEVTELNLIDVGIGGCGDENGKRNTAEDDESGCFGKPGSQIDHKIIFKNKFGESVAAIPVIIDFNRVLQLKQVGKDEGVISGVSNRDLLHAVAGLYDISLPDMDTETIYSTVCARWSRTIVLVQEIKDAADDMTERNIKRKRKKNKNENNSKIEVPQNEREQNWRKKVDESNDTYKEVVSPDSYSAFVDIFSDTDEDSEEEKDTEEEGDWMADSNKRINTLGDIITKYIFKNDDCLDKNNAVITNIIFVVSGVLDKSITPLLQLVSFQETCTNAFLDDDEDFTKGVFTFLSDATKRLKQREKCDAIIPTSIIGIENRLLACVTFEKKYIEHKDRVIHLTLISVRPRFRMFRIGRYLLSKCVVPSVVGQYDAVVVHADNSAVEFFRKFGFSDDIILNSRWRQLAEAFTNCTLMSYLPAFTSHNLLQVEITKNNEFDLFELDQEMKTWQKKSRESYLGQICCMLRYRNEVLQLRQLVRAKNELGNTDSSICKERFSLDQDSDEINTEELLVGLEEEVAALSAASHVRPESPPPPITSSIGLPSAPFKVDSKTEILTRFVRGMETDRTLNIVYTVSSLLKAPENPSLSSRFEMALSNMSDSSMVTELYFCGLLEKPKRLLQILSDGFTEADFIHGEFGRGLYFSKYPSKAAQFSVLGKLLEVRVGLGRVETVTRYDKTRKAPSERNDSIIVPGRLFHGGSYGETAMLCQEYVVFNVDQVMPLCLLSYTYVDHPSL